MSLKHWLRLEWDRISGSVLMAAGAVVLVVGLLGVTDSADVVDQLSYLGSGGIGGLFLLGAGSTLLLSADLHDDWRKLARVETELRRVGDLLEQNAETLRYGEIQVGEAATTNGLRRQAEASLLGSERGAVAIRTARQVSAVVLLMAGAVFAIGVARATGDGDFDRAAAGVAIAGGGAALVAVQAAGTVHRLRRLFRVQRDAVIGEVAARLVPAEDRTEAPGGADSTVWTVEGLPRYHAARCAALDDRPARPLPLDKLPAGLTPCGLCLSSD